MYQVSFFQYPPKEIVAIDFILQDSVYIFTDGKSTVAAFPASVVSGIIHSVTGHDEDTDGEDYEDVEPLPEVTGKQIQFFSYAPVPAMTQEQLQDELSYRVRKSLEYVTQQTGVRSVDAPLSEEAQAVEKYYKAEEKTRADFKKEAIGILSTFGAPSAITNSPASGEQLPIATSTFVPGAVWGAGYSLSNTEKDGFEASMKLKQDTATQQKEIASSANEAVWHKLCEQPANEAKVVEENYRNQMKQTGDHYAASFKQSGMESDYTCVSTGSLWILYHQAKRQVEETLIEIQDRIFAKQRQDDIEKEALDEDYGVGPRPPAVHPKDSDLCSFENVVAGATFLRGLEY